MCLTSALTIITHIHYSFSAIPDLSMQRSVNSVESSGRLCSSPIMQQQLQHFSREVVDVLRNCVACRMPFDRFIPSYHHHHGRQCRVADYGYTRLMDLLDAVPHVVQASRRWIRQLISLFMLSFLLNQSVCRC